MIKRLFIVIGILLLSQGACAKVAVEATIDSIQIFVGAQAHVLLKVTSGNDARVELPPFKPMTEVLPNVELLAISTPDTSSFDGNRVVSQVFTFTSFDAGLYYLPPLPVKIDGKEYKSESLALKVLTIDVDTTKLDQFFPAKDVQKNPFSWDDWKPVLFLYLLLNALAALFLCAYIRLKSNKPIRFALKVVKKILPHQKALKVLQETPLSEDTKEYYTQLTDTLRRYIEERFGFRAMEMTSDEIITRLKESSDEESLNELVTLFRTADLVKFAKYSTMMNENDMNLVNAIDFIKKTKQEDQPVEQVVKPEISSADKRTITQRRVMKVIILISVILALAAAVYIGFELYDLLA